MEVEFREELRLSLFDLEASRRRLISQREGAVIAVASVATFLIAATASRVASFTEKPRQALVLLGFLEGLRANFNLLSHNLHLVEMKTREMGNIQER